MVAAARARSRALGLPFNLTPEDIKIPKVCPVLGIPLRRSSNRASAGSPSLDRISPSEGYVRGNVIVVSHRANTLKGDATIHELKKIARFYSNLKRN